jgi:SOS-response transcriptional repressor LexA
MTFEIQDNLTDIQRKIVLAIADYWDAHDRSPSNKELEQALGIHYFTLKSHLWTLKAKGVIDFTDGRLRTLRLLKPLIAS